MGLRWANAASSSLMRLHSFDDKTMKNLHALALALCLQMSVASSTALADTIDHSHIKELLSQAGLSTPITHIEPSDLTGFGQITLAGGSQLLISDDLGYLIQGTASANPSPSIPIAAEVRRTLPMGTPVSTAHKQALLANMTAMRDINDGAAFYHTGIKGILWGISSLGDTTFLVSDDGRYLMDGMMAGLKGGKFQEHTPLFEAAKNRHILSSLQSSMMAVYPAKTSERAVLYVVSDIHCPYCKILHDRIEELSLQGITTKVIGYPVYDESIEPMRQMQCESDNARRSALLSAAFKGITPARAVCQGTDPLADTARHILALDVTATPAVYRADGSLFTGDLQGEALYHFLGLR